MNDMNGIQTVKPDRVREQSQQDTPQMGGYIEWNELVKRVERLEKLLDRLQAVTTYVE